ncbi:sensor histidine kinase [Actinomadura macrotermitis]|uniref:histidine kinase n=1 Tax=Actinomadura macrotermitis TaxID=2585200 RepID=A0A7K0C1V8_9ACTN|nr:hypothetical protein [Actinomadura macrotermitis]
MNLSPACTSGTPRARGTTVLMAAVGVPIALTLWGRHDLLLLDAAAGLASWALLPLLVRRPVAVTLVLDVLAVLSPSATPASTVGTLQVAGVRSVRVAVAVGLAGIAAHAARPLVQPIPLPFGWWLLLVAIAHAALIGWGALIQARRALIASLRDRAERAEADRDRRVAEARALERARIAREMHDVLAHRLSLLATYAGALEYRPDASPEKLARAAGVIRSSAHQALGELRDVLTVLRADDAEDAAPQPVLADLPRLLAEAEDAGTPVAFTDRTAGTGTLPPTLSRTVYRVVQEGLTNARKHAPGSRVRIVLDGEPGGRLTVELSNPLGPGPADTASPIPGSGTGLIGLTERVRLAGGALDHGATPGGFGLRAWLPFPECAP